MSTPPDARRLHPLSPLAAVGTYLIPAFFGLVIFFDGLGVLPRAGLFVAIVVIGGAFAWFAWLRTYYWFDEDGDLRVSSGVFFKSERRVQLSRLQAVDVHRPLVARIIGLAELRPEVAGGESSKARLSYLSESDAHALRNELLARSAGVTPDSDGTAPEAPEQVLVKVPGPDLAVSGLLDVGFLVALVIGIGVIAVFVITGNVAGLVGLIFVGGFPVFAAASYFMTYFDFTLADSPDGLRLRYGLLNTRSQTVPPGRVQAVRVSQPLLWRRKGWVRVEVNVAGYGGGDSGSGSAGTMLLPVAPRDVGLGVLQRVLPGVDIETVELVAAPARARRRAPFQGRRLAVGADDRVLVMRSGWLTHRWDVVPHARMQSARITQGPWQRALKIASLHVDSTPGPIKPVGLHRDVASIRADLEDEVVRARASRAAFRPERWMQS